MGYEVTLYALTAFYLFGISVQDVRWRKISNFAPLIIIMASPFISSTPLLERAVGLLGLFVPLIAVNVLTGGFGMGDVKLCSAFGWLLGALSEYCALAAALIAAVTVGKITKNKSLPLAPFICGASMAAVIFKEVLLRC